MYIKLEALRGLFAILIILSHSPFHLGPLPQQMSLNAEVIVDCFFILSGWTMSFGYQQRIQQGMLFGHYIGNRLARFYPLYLFMAVVWAPYIYVTYDPAVYDTSQVYFQSLIANVLLVQNLIDLPFFINPPAWMMSAEFSAYCLLFFTLRCLDKKARLFIPIMLIILGYSSLYIYHEGNIFQKDSWGSVRCISGFFLGVLLYRLGALVDFSKLSGNIAECSIALLLFISFQYAHLYPLLIFLNLGLMGLVILLFTQEKHGVLGHFFTRPYLIALGGLSYGIYICHYLIIQLIMPLFNEHIGGWYAIGVNLCIIITTIAVAFILNRMLEEPIRKRWSHSIKARYVEHTATAK